MHLSCAASRFVSAASREGSRTVVAMATAVSLIFVVAVTAAAAYGWLPRFFTPDVGTTWAAKAALVAAISTFLLASLLIGASSRSVILYWYSWALAVTAVGLIGLLVSGWLFENVVFWVGRIGLCVGGIFLVFSITAPEKGSDPPPEDRQA